jgi:hypothetical protein
MNKKFSFIILSMAFVLAISAMASATPIVNTIVTGVIYNNPTFTNTVSGANVTVNCNGHIKNTLSLNDGSYEVLYSNSLCNVNDSLSVSAVKGDLYGSKTGEVHSITQTWNFAVVNVPLVPEFGLIAGSLTILSAVGIFFFVRKK